MKFSGPTKLDQVKQRLVKQLTLVAITQVYPYPCVDYTTTSVAARVYGLAGCRRSALPEGLCLCIYSNDGWRTDLDVVSIGHQFIGYNTDCEQRVDTVRELQQLQEFLNQPPSRLITDVPVICSNSNTPPYSLNIHRISENKKLSWCWQQARRVSGQSRSTNVVPFHMLHIVSYCAIVTSSLRCAVFTIFVFKKFHDLEMGVKGHSRSLRVVSFHRLCMVSY